MEIDEELVELDFARLVPRQPVLCRKAAAAPLALELTTSTALSIAATVVAAASIVQ